MYLNYADASWKRSYVEAHFKMNQGIGKTKFPHVLELKIPEHGWRKIFPTPSFCIPNM
jgi:hypothetical protein